MKIGILISGRGSNMEAIVRAVQDGRIPDSDVAVVISDKIDAAGLETANRLGIDSIVVSRKKRSREEHDAEIISELSARGVELVCLAGYMRLLSGDFIRAFPDRIVNVHPSLLPAFPGLEAQRQAIEYGVKISGCTIHFVDEHLDHGAIILQKAVEVAENDTAESLSAKILEHEHTLYIEAIKKIVAETVEIRGRRVIGK